MAQSPEEMADSIIRNLEEKTGKSLPQWLKIAKGSKLAKHGQLIKFLKIEHGMTHGYANLVAMKSLEPAGGAPAGDALVDAQYSGQKAGLRPIYDVLAGAVAKFGKDVEISPKKAYVSLRRSKQFAIIQPSTSARIDVGINLKGAKATNRLESSGSFNSMVSHRVRVTKKSEVDAELKGWLKKAYESS
jgi:predicted transport protein